MAFQVADYIVMASFLLISAGIGLYFGICKKQRTTEEYLLGGRQLHLLPVSISLLVTYQSAISVIGTPVEVYVYDLMWLYSIIGVLLASVVQAFLIVPLLHPLYLTSVYEVFILTLF